jgi:hypothetical protein
MFATWFHFHVISSAATARSSSASGQARVDAIRGRAEAAACSLSHHKATASFSA